ncbi:hypothetical protein FSP39_022695 [Pinctada imbricata]|uniref:Uncharacterized protein n=1 Tax=Pinctada imbricata TaxID=66713 RepID=A0AA88YL65_PINIB|nr:hypothetical protein FSP39_022695 [Pinctada imbricata]
MDFDYRKYENMSWNRQEVNTPLATLFTTWNPAMQRPIVYSNTMRTWASMSARINNVVFTNDSKVSIAAKRHGWKNYSISNTACFGTPVLRTMFQEAIRKERSILYGYSNADILFNDGLIPTLEAITGSEEFDKGPILVVGKRIDVNISKLHEPVVRTPREVNKLAKHGALSWGFAGDYFFTNDLFPWEFIPDLVVGRPLVDNWLIWYARKVGAKIIDASASVLAVHQLANGLKRIKTLCNKAEAWKRHLLPNLPIYQGLIECADYETRIDPQGQILIYKKMFQYELCKHSEAKFH